MDMAICRKGCLQSVAIYTFDLKGTRNTSQKKTFPQKRGRQFTVGMDVHGGEVEPDYVGH
jgi:hypothetical protein